MDLMSELLRMRKLQRIAPARIAKIAEAATVVAVDKAAELTPPTMDDMTGTNTRTGSMKASWRESSTVTPEYKDGAYVTVLGNSMEYASYVNDGHRMDRHFVPGLMINPSSGMLERVPKDAGGIMVGTKTKYVPGVHMVDAAQEEYDKAVERLVDELLEEFK